MSADMHLRAEQFIAQERIEGLAQLDREWLRAHLQECAQCNNFAQQTEFALRALRAAAVPVPAGLASRTQFRLRLRAQELSGHEPNRRTLWLACALSWVFGIASAPQVWRLFAWFGARAGLPKIVWEVGFGLWWTIPALFFVLVVLAEKLGPGSEADWTRQSR